ncbi:MAG: topology modulation protein [Eubacteriales bacterium]|nr:topology modulation protein [Eubacteriales bacterium]
MSKNNIGKKIMVIGSTGSGKSTFSRHLAGITGIPLIHLDQEFWNPGWLETPKDEWTKKQETLISGDEWIIDGNYGDSMNKRLEKADTVIYFDFNKFVCLKNYLKRLISNYGHERPDMAEGCIEKLDFEFVKYIWNFTKTEGQRNKERLKRYQDKNIIVFRKRSEVKKFLKATCYYDEKK